MVNVLPGNILRELLSISDELKRGYELKDLFLDIVNHAKYKEEKNSPYQNAKKQLLNFIELSRASKIEEFIEASKTIENWLPYIVNSFIDEKYSNGFTEGINNKIKVIKRNAFGYKSFKLLRSRLLYIFNKTLGGSNKNDK